MTKDELLGESALVGNFIVSRSFRLKAKINEIDEWKPIERIDFFQNTFGIWYKDTITTEAFVPDIKIEAIVDKNSNCLFGDMSNAFAEFADCIINSFQAAGGTKENGEKYFRENFC